ncbi:MAG: NYN domain-containing protein [Ignavibacteria bacterium]
METIIIDSYNLMHKVKELHILLKQDQDVTVDTMVAKMQSYFTNNRVKVILAFDGYGKNKHMGNIDAKFSKTNTSHGYENADELIKALIEKTRNKKLIKVVSSDNEVTNFARECGCKVQGSASFWGELKEKRVIRMKRSGELSEKPQVVTRGEFEYLLKEFKKN